MDHYDEELWAKLVEESLFKYQKRLRSFDFWVYPLEMYDREGNAYTYLAPKIAINFKWH